MLCILCHLKSRTERIEGWADIFNRKVSEKRRQAKVKRPQKSTPLCVTGRTDVYFQLTSCLSSPGDMQEAPKDLLKRSKCISFCLLSFGTQVKVHRLSNATS